MKSEERVGSDEQPGQARGDVLLAVRDEQKRQHDFAHRQGQDFTPACANLSETVMRHRERQKHQRRHRDAREYDNRWVHFRDRDLDEQVRHAAQHRERSKEQPRLARPRSAIKPHAGGARLAGQTPQQPHSGRSVQQSMI